MKFQVALSMSCLFLITMTIQSTSARFSFRNVTVNGILTQQSAYCRFIGGKQLANFPSITDQQLCAQKCVSNPNCTHYNAFGCTLLQSSTCLNINMNTYQSCGYVPARTCPKQATTVDNYTTWISVCQ